MEGRVVFDLPSSVERGDAPLVWVGERLSDLAAPGASPRAIVAAVVRTAPERVVAGPTLRAVIADVEVELFCEGDRATVDGSTGDVTLPDVTDVPVVTSFLIRPDGRILLLRRSEKVGSFQGRWAGVSGYLEESPPMKQAITEILEETGIAADALRLVRSGAPVRTRDGPRVFTVHGFSFAVSDPQVVLDWEHTAFDWVEPDELTNRPTVPRLEEVWRSVEPPVTGEARPKR